MTTFVQPLVLGRPRKNEDVLQHYAKLKSSMRYWLLAKLESDPAMLPAYQAFERLIAKEFTSEGVLRLRKDGITPEVMHQLRLAHHVKSLWRYFLHPIPALITAFEHDSMEDDKVLFTNMKKLYGGRTAGAIQRMSKKFYIGIEPVNTELRVQVGLPELFEAMANCPISSVLKLIDRIDNIRYMLGVFSPKKQREYIHEVFIWFLPMAKKARLTFPQQEPLYELLKRHLVNMCDIYLAHLDALDEKENEIEALKAQVAALTAQVETLTTQQGPILLSVNDCMATA